MPRRDKNSTYKNALNAHWHAQKASFSIFSWSNSTIPSCPDFAFSFLKFSIISQPSLFSKSSSFCLSPKWVLFQSSFHRFSQPKLTKASSPQLPNSLSQNPITHLHQQSATNSKPASLETSSAYNQKQSLNPWTWISPCGAHLTVPRWT